MNALNTTIFIFTMIPFSIQLSAVFSMNSNLKGGNLRRYFLTFLKQLMENINASTGTTCSSTWIQLNQPCSSPIRQSSRWICIKNRTGIEARIRSLQVIIISLKNTSSFCMDLMCFNVLSTVFLHGESYVSTLFQTRIYLSKNVNEISSAINRDCRKNQRHIARNFCCLLWRLIWWRHKLCRFIRNLPIR